MYYSRLIDSYLAEWKDRAIHKPLLVRGARQVGKSWAVRHLGESFESFVEINFEKNPDFKRLFSQNLDVFRIVSELAAITRHPIEPGRTLLFLDEIQQCPEAIMALRFFKEDMPQLHVIAAGSLLEFALEELPTFGVGRIHSLFMYPMTFDEFVEADGGHGLIEMRNSVTPEQPLSPAIHERLVSLFRTYLIVGGMPEAVARWVESHDYLQAQEVQEDILVSYESDFPKYKKKVSPALLRQVFRSVALQTGSKFVYSEVGGGYSTPEVKKALELLILAGLCVPVTRSAGNGLPLGAEADYEVRKMMVMDTGLMLRMLSLWVGEGSEEITRILTENPTELVNKGGITEMFAGLELRRYHTPNLRYELFYWQRAARNSQAEIDYLIVRNRKVCPVEVKAGTRGGMKSLWLFMREKSLTDGIRTSLENVGQLDYTDPETGALRHVLICPLYALSRLTTANTMT